MCCETRRPFAAGPQTQQSPVCAIDALAGDRLPQRDRHRGRAAVDRGDGRGPRGELTEGGQPARRPPPPAGRLSTRRAPEDPRSCTADRSAVRAEGRESPPRASGPRCLERRPSSSRPARRPSARPAACRTHPGGAERGDPGRGHATCRPVVVRRGDDLPARGRAARRRGRGPPGAPRGGHDPAPCGYGTATRADGDAGPSSMFFRTPQTGGQERRAWDSNPRWVSPQSGFQDRRTRPLCEPSSPAIRQPSGPSEETVETLGATARRAHAVRARHATEVSRTVAASRAGSWQVRDTAVASGLAPGPVRSRRSQRATHRV